MIDADALLDKARDALGGSYAPYSRFHVAAAVLLSDGRILTGANVENASYGLSLCAETVALAKVANAGALGSVVAIAITAGKAAENGAVVPLPEEISPCGRCRQMLAEAAQLGGHDIEVICASVHGNSHYTLSQLLPHAFTLDSH